MPTSATPPCVVIQGSDEKAKGEVTIKDLIVGAELAKLEKGREEHLQKQAEAQRAVPEAQLVEAVRAVLARHKLGAALTPPPSLPLHGCHRAHGNKSPAFGFIE